MSNWGKLLVKENNRLKQEATLLRQQVKLVKQVKTLQQELNFRRSSTTSSSKPSNSKQVSCFSGSNKENELKLLEKESKIETLQTRGLVSRKSNQSENYWQDERGLLDSFESYYESEEENLDKNGKVELSYQQYKKSHIKGSRRRSKVKPLTEDKPDLQLKPLGLRKRACKASSIIIDDLLFRKANCRICDQFLHQGLSSSKCRKHSCDIIKNN